MYIKQISIDGFKSYAQRTVVDGFDPLFNAITGLNGSGKSNILDSICFVLGITNLNQVRATNLQDLVYKLGQAGVTKATVSITFDNSDKSQSPVGYEQYQEITVTRQVVIGGRNKYLINGTNAQNNRVADLFRSVQLNVNNPHFLIMQGRITKVLNMKPPEILSMIEEAAGTKMYESKKQSALRTIEKKEAKLKEIDHILAEEITPTLAKLREDRASYMEYQRLQQEIEKLSRLTVAYEYVRLKESQSASKPKVREIREQVANIKQTMETNRDKCQQLTQEIEELEARARREASSKKGDSLETLEAELSERQKDETVANAALDHKREELKSEEKKHRQLLKRVEDEKKSLAAKVKQLETAAATIAECEEQASRDVQELEAAQKRIQALATGLSANDEGGEDATLAAQLLAAKDDLSRAEMEYKQADLKLKRLRPELKKLQSTSGRAEADYVEAKKTYDKGMGEIKRLEARLAEIGYKEGSEENLKGERRQLIAEAEHLRRQLEELEDSVPRLKFEYRNPSPNFDRSSVKGLVAKLIRLKDANTATAIEVAAGDRLFNVIVDTEVVSKELLQNGQLKQRVTLIPLNKISAQTIRPEIVRKAKSLVGDNNCHLALSLIDYPAGIQKALEYVLGNTLICTDMDVAKQVTFHPDIMKRTVTLRGEVFDPQGTLTGGSRKENSSVLKRMHELGPTTLQLEGKRRRLAEIDIELQAMSNSANEWRTIKEKLASVHRDVETAKTKLEGTSHHQQLAEIQRMEEAIQEAEAALANSSDARTKAVRRIAELEDRMRNADKYHEKETKQAEERLKEAKKRSEQSAKALKKKQEGTEAMKLEVQELKAAIEGYGNELSELGRNAETMKQEVTDLTAASDATKEAVREVEARVSEKRDSMKARDQEITNRQNEHDTIVKESRKAELQIKHLQQDEEKLEAEAREGARKLEQMTASYGWIRHDEKYFGQAGTAYDFAANDAKVAARQLHQAQERKEKLQRTVNMRAMNMLVKAEEQYKTLLDKKRIVGNDKAKIEAVILELDEKKRQTIEKAWEQVNHDFGSIFSTLLPGANAKLEPPRGQSPLDGLEVRVGFGDVWKDALSELSGGQKSLVALSLILAMLLFKPAPIYILDEVDAALDLSHTQNIGQMLRTHFKHSQFIVVSLKDGMFNNANVLFRTKFVDGCSTVTRHVQHQ